MNQHPNIVIAVDEADTGYFERLGASTEVFFERCFTAWGTYCAEKPWFILFLGFCFVCAMGHGIKYLKITTDPVELWAAPNSRSRIEREIFDSNFEPFYRIEQVSKLTSIEWNEVRRFRFFISHLKIYFRSLSKPPIYQISYIIRQMDQLNSDLSTIKNFYSKFLICKIKSKVFQFFVRRTFFHH